MWPFMRQVEHETMMQLRETHMDRQFTNVWKISKELPFSIPAQNIQNSHTITSTFKYTNFPRISRTHGNIEGVHFVPHYRCKCHLYHYTTVSIVQVIWKPVGMWILCVHAVLAWLHDLFCDIVEEIPATVGEGGLKKGQRYLSHWRLLTEFKGHTGPQSLIVTWEGERKGCVETRCKI